MSKPQEKTRIPRRGKERVYWRGDWVRSKEGDVEYRVTITVRDVPKQVAA